MSSLINRSLPLWAAMSSSSRKGSSSWSTTARKRSVTLRFSGAGPRSAPARRNRSATSRPASSASGASTRQAQTAAGDPLGAHRTRRAPNARVTVKSWIAPTLVLVSFARTRLLAERHEVGRRVVRRALRRRVVDRVPTSAASAGVARQPLVDRGLQAGRKARSSRQHPFLGEDLQVPPRRVVLGHRQDVEHPRALAQPLVRPRPRRRADRRRPDQDAVLHPRAAAGRR